MLKQILDENNISAYALAKKSGVPYSTLADLVSGKTSIDNVSAAVLYRLSKALDMTMEQLYLYKGKKEKLYLYNVGREIFCSIKGKTISYLGPKNLLGFKRVNQNKQNCLYVECYFLNELSVIYTEEDYIDLEELFEENGLTGLLDEPYEVILGRPRDSYQKYLLENAMLVSDNMAILLHDGSTRDVIVDVVNVKRNSDKMMLRLRDYAILLSNMSETLKKRAIKAVERNEKLIYEEIEEMKDYA